MDTRDLNGVKTITVAGEKVEVNATDDVKSTLKSLLESRGIDSFSVILDGEEVKDSADLPETFADVTILEVARSAKAGY